MQVGVPPAAPKRVTTLSGMDFEVDDKYELIKPIGFGAYGIVVYVVCRRGTALLVSTSAAWTPLLTPTIYVVVLRVYPLATAFSWLPPSVDADLERTTPCSRLPRLPSRRCV